MLTVLMGESLEEHKHREAQPAGGNNVLVFELVRGEQQRVIKLYPWTRFGDLRAADNDAFYRPDRPSNVAVQQCAIHFYINAETHTAIDR